MLTQRWTRDAVLARMAAESALELDRKLSEHDRAATKLSLDKIRQDVESGALGPMAAASRFDVIRQQVSSAA